MRELLLLLVANGMEGGRRSVRKLLLLPYVVAGLESARYDFGQLFVETGVDGSKGGGVQMLFPVTPVGYATGSCSSLRRLGRRTQQ